jgi:YD repeat-containing protein
VDTIVGAVTGSAWSDTTYSHDAAGRVSDMTDGIGAVTHYVYDALGQVTDTIFAYGTGDATTTHRVYDAAGRITKQQGAELKQRIESGDVPLFAGPGFGGHGERHHLGPFGGLDAAATFLGLTQTQLETKLEAGKTLAAIAKDEGKSSDGLVAAMIAALQKRLDAAVTAGGLTKAQEASILAGAKARMTNFVNGKEPVFRGDGDGDHGFGFGPLGGGPPSAALEGPGI